MPTLRAAAGKQPSTSRSPPPTSRALSADPLQFSYLAAEDALECVQGSIVSWDTLQLDLNWLGEPSCQQAPAHNAANPPEQGPSPASQLSCLPALDDLLHDPASLDEGSTLLDDSEEFPTAMMELLGLPEQALSSDPPGHPSASAATANLRADLGSPGSSISSCNLVGFSPSGTRSNSPATSLQLLQGAQLPQQLPQQLPLPLDRPLESKVLAVPSHGRQPQHSWSLFSPPYSRGAAPHARAPTPMQQAPCLQQPHVDHSCIVPGAATSPQPHPFDSSRAKRSCGSPDPKFIAAALNQQLISCRDQPRTMARLAAAPVMPTCTSPLDCMQIGSRLPDGLNSITSGPVTQPARNASPATADYGENARTNATLLQSAAERGMPGHSQSCIQDGQGICAQWGLNTGAQNPEDTSLNYSTGEAQLGGCPEFHNLQPSPKGSMHDMCPAESDPYSVPHESGWRRLRARLWGNEDSTPEAMADLGDAMVAEPSSSVSTLPPLLQPAHSLANEGPSLRSEAAASSEISLHATPSFTGPPLRDQGHLWGQERSPSNCETAPAMEARSSSNTIAKPRAFSAPRVYTSSSHGQPWQSRDEDLLNMQPLSPPADLQLPTSNDSSGFIGGSQTAWEEPSALLSPQLPWVSGRRRAAQHSEQPAQTLTAQQQQQQHQHQQYRANLPLLAKPQVVRQHADAPAPLTIREDSVERQVLAWSAEGVEALPQPAPVRQQEMRPRAQQQVAGDTAQLQEVPNLGPSPASSAETACKVPLRLNRGQKRRRGAVVSAAAAEKQVERVCQWASEEGEPQPSAKRGCKAVVSVRPGRGNVHAAMVGQSKASQQLKALEQINKVFQRDQGQIMPEPPFPRPKKQKPVVHDGGPRTQQLVLEKNVEKLIDDVYMLGVKGVSLSERRAATKRTVQAIQDACALCSRPSSQAHFVPHLEVSRVAAECKLDAQGIVEGALRCRCSKPVRISHGPLKGITASDQLLQASETACSETETAYVPALVSALTATRNGEEEHSGETAQRLAVELSLLFVLRTHLRRSSMIAAQQEGLTRLQSQSRLQSCISDEALASVALTKAQVEELVGARENYMTRTRRILQQRQALWQMVRANLLDTSLQDGCPSAESKICAFEKVLELQRNMDDYHWNFAWLMREWCLRILSPPQVANVLASFASSCDSTCQVMACAGFYLLETLALRADSDPAPEMLAGLDIPAPQDFSNLPNSDPE